MSGRRQEHDGEEVSVAIEETIDTQIEGLIVQLAAADADEAARIRTRIDELKSLKKEHVTT